MGTRRWVVECVLHIQDYNGFDFNLQIIISESSEILHRKWANFYMETVKEIHLRGKTSSLWKCTFPRTKPRALCWEVLSSHPRFVRKTGAAAQPGSPSSQSLRMISSNLSKVLSGFKISQWNQKKTAFTHSLSMWLFWQRFKPKRKGIQHFLNGRTCNRKERGTKKARWLCGWNQRRLTWRKKMMKT